MLLLTETFVSVLIEALRAPLGADSILQHISVHAQQAVRAQRASAGVTAPVTLWKEAAEKSF